MTQVRAVRIPGCLFGLALLLLTAIPLSELALLIYSAKTIGLWWTLGLCLLTAIAGSALARWQGARVLLQAQQAFAEGRFPADSILDGACLLVGGVLLLTPGFLSDVMGFVLLLPPTRAVLKHAARSWWRRRQGRQPPTTVDIRPL